MNDDSRRLGLEIARCPVIEAVVRGDPSPCKDVVQFQKRALPFRWLAEPWTGHLERAPILFVSSNPSSGDPEAPVDPNDVMVSSEDETVLHAFNDAFDPGPWIGIHEGTHLRAANRKVGSYIAYWGSCKARASELLGRPASPGHDYALTEVVHCGSKREIGALAAAKECVPRYLNRVLHMSPAVVVIVVGSLAAGIVRSMALASSDESRHIGPIDWAGRERHAIFLPHPNARGVPKAITPYLGGHAEEVLEELRAAIGRASC